MERRNLIQIGMIGIATVLTGCSTATLGLFNRQAAGPDQGVVESFVRFNDLVGARDYLVRFGLKETEVIERLQRAKEKVANEK